MCDQQRLRPVCAYAQTDQSLCWLLKYSMTVKLLTKRHLRCQSLKGGCTCSSESTHVKMSNCWKSNVTAHLMSQLISFFLCTAGCHAGSYSNISGNTVHCVPCPRGQYQPESYKDHCLNCPTDYDTVKTGSTRLQQCIGKF